MIKKLFMTRAVQVSFFRAWFCGSKAAVRKKTRRYFRDRPNGRKRGGGGQREAKGFMIGTGVRFIIAKFAISTVADFTPRIRDGD